MSKGNKQPPKKRKGAPTPSPVPKVRQGDQPPDSSVKRLTPSEPDTKLVISLAWVDINSPWCLSHIESGHHRDLLQSIRNFESMTVNEIVHSKQGCQDYPLDDLIDQAYQRLVERELDDRDVVHRLRITGERRLFGFLEDNRFYVLWWDPHHEIVPSYKKHT